MSMQKASTKQVFHRWVATIAASIYSVHQLSRSCGWSSSQGICWEITPSLVGNTHPISQGFELALATIFFKKQKMFRSTLARFMFIPARQDEKKTSMIFWCSQNDFQAGVWAQGREAPWSWEMKSMSSIHKAGSHLIRVIWEPSSNHRDRPSAGEED